MSKTSFQQRLAVFQVWRKWMQTQGKPAPAKLESTTKESESQDSYMVRTPNKYKKGNRY